MTTYKKLKTNTKSLNSGRTISPELGAGTVLVEATLIVLESTTVCVCVPIDTSMPVDKVARVEILSVLLSVSNPPRPVDIDGSSVTVVIVSTLVVLLSVYVFKQGLVLVIWIANEEMSVQGQENVEASLVVVLLLFVKSVVATPLGVVIGSALPG